MNRALKPMDYAERQHAVARALRGLPAFAPKPVEVYARDSGKAIKDEVTVRHVLRNGMDAVDAPARPLPLADQPLALPIGQGYPSTASEAVNRAVGASEAEVAGGQRPGHENAATGRFQASPGMFSAGYLDALLPEPVEGQGSPVVLLAEPVPVGEGASTPVEVQPLPDDAPGEAVEVAPERVEVNGSLWQLVGRDHFDRLPEGTRLVRVGDRCILVTTRRATPQAPATDTPPDDADHGDVD